MKTNSYEEWLDKCSTIQRGFDCKSLETAIFKKACEYQEQYGYFDPVKEEDLYGEICSYHKGEAYGFSIHIEPNIITFYVPEEVAIDGSISFIRKRNCYYFESLKSYTGEDGLKAMLKLKNG